MTDESQPDSTAKLPSSDRADLFLGRILRREVDVSALLAYCAALDPAPLQRALDLSEPIADVQVEVPHKKSSRMDVVLYASRVDGLRPQAVLELKVSASEHGDQLARYEAYSKADGAKKFLVDLELIGASCPEGWSRRNLADIFACWEYSEDLTVRAVAIAIANLFRNWTKQTVGLFGDMDPAMISVVTRSIASSLTADGIRTIVAKTSAGLPALVSRAPHPADPQNASLCVVVRQERAVPMPVWSMRVGVEVNEGLTGRTPRAVAHELMSELAPMLSLTDMRKAISSRDSVLSATITGKRSFKNPASRDSRIETWLNPAARAEPGNHPLYYNDFGGRRLSAKCGLEISAISPDDLGTVIRAIMEHLARSASSRAEL